MLVCHVTCTASRACPISAASAVASCSWNYWRRRRLFVKFVTAKRLSARMATRWSSRRVRHYKEVVCKNGHSLVEPSSSSLQRGCLQEWPLAGRATVPRVLYGIGLCMSLRRRTILCDGRPLALPFTFSQADIYTVDRTVGRRFVREGDNCEVWKAFVCRYAPPRSCCGWRIAQDKRCMSAPRRLHWMSSDVIDTEFALRRCQCARFVDRTFFCICNVAIDFWFSLKTMVVHSTASSELHVELLPRLSKNLPRCCEKELLSAPGVGFSNFETNNLVFSITSTTKCLRRWGFWYNKWFCSFKNLSRVLPSLRSNGKSQLRRRWWSTGLVQDTSVCGGMVANRFGLLVLRFSDWFFFSREVNTKDLWSTFYV